MDYEIKKGGHKDLRRIYPMLEFDFPAQALVGQPGLHRALMRGAAELLLLKDENGLERGYAVVFRQSLYGYVQLAYAGVYPTFRGQGAGSRFMALLRERYKGSRGILLMAPYREAAARERLGEFLARQGFGRLDSRGRVRGLDADILCLRLMGTADPSVAAPLILRDLCARVVPEPILDKHLSFNT